MSDEVGICGLLVFFTYCEASYLFRRKLIRRVSVSPASADVNLNGDSAGCDFPHRSGRIVSAGDAKGSDNLGEDSVCGGVGGATNPINVTGSGSKAVRSVELASSWEKVDMKPSLWGQPPPDMDALNCQRYARCSARSTQQGRTRIYLLRHWMVQRRKN